MRRSVCLQALHMLLLRVSVTALCYSWTAVLGDLVSLFCVAVNSEARRFYLFVVMCSIGAMVFCVCGNGWVWNYSTCMQRRYCVNEWPELRWRYGAPSHLWTCKKKECQLSKRYRSLISVIGGHICACVTSLSRQWRKFTFPDYSADRKKKKKESDDCPFRRVRLIAKTNSRTWSRAFWSRTFWSRTWSRAWNLALEKFSA